MHSIETISNLAEPQPSEQASELLLMALPDAVIYSDTNRVIQKVNPAFTEIFGYTPDDIIGKVTHTLYSELTSFHEQGQIRYNTQSNSPPKPYDMAYKRKNGEIFNAMSIGTTVRDASGKAIGFMLLLRDITANKQIESDYIRLATAVEQAAENVVITDPEGKIQYVNPSFEKNTGYTKAEVIGKTPAILNSGNHDKLFYQDIWSTITSGEPWAGQIKNKRKDGSYFIEDCIISPVFSESGEIINFVGVKHDITRTLELEEQTRQSQRIESLGRLAGGVAHDINNMLFPILGHTDLLLQDLAESSLIREPMEEVHKAAEKIRILVRQLLAFGRKQTLEMGPLNLNHTVKGFEKLLRKTIRENVLMNISLAPSLPLIMADEGQIEQIIMNLVVNAHYAMPIGGQLDIRTGSNLLQNSKENNTVFIQVTDTGVGMDDPTRSRIFEPFFTTRSDGHGTGLGLSTVYGIVKQHQGQISVKSEVGKGSCFTISFPVCEEVGDFTSPVKEPLSPLPQNKAKKNKIKAKKVLLAEDNPMAMGIAKHTLSRLGYDVVMAGDGLECRTFLSTYDGPLDLLLSDVIMPKVDGWRLHQYVEKQFPDVKTLFMSGYSHDVIDQYRKMGKTINFISKPFSKNQLSEKISALL